MPGDAPPLALLLAGGGLCNDAILQHDTHTGRLSTVGDPTEGALLVAAARDGLDPTELARAMPRVAELPFDSERKRMTTVHTRAAAGLPAAIAAVWGRDRFEPQAGYLAITKGAVDGLLDISTRVWVNGRAVPLDAAQRARIGAANNLGSIIGPAVGGLLATLSLLAPFVLAVISVGIAAVLSYFLLPTAPRQPAATIHCETLPKPWTEASVPAGFRFSSLSA